MDEIDNIAAVRTAYTCFSPKMSAKVTRVSTHISSIRSRCTYAKPESDGCLKMFTDAGEPAGLGLPIVKQPTADITLVHDL
jgi:hypothetical protein